MTDSQALLYIIAQASLFVKLFVNELGHIFDESEAVGVVVGPVDELAVKKEGGGVFDLVGDGFGEGDVEVDFGFYLGAAHVGEEFFFVALAVSDGVEIVNKLFGAGVSVGIIPLGLVFEEIVAIGFPIALEASGLGGRSGGNAVAVVGKDIAAMDDGDFAGVFFD